MKYEILVQVRDKTVTHVVKEAEVILETSMMVMVAVTLLEETLVAVVALVVAVVMVDVVVVNTYNGFCNGSG